MLQLQIMNSAVIRRPMCRVYLFLHRKFMDLDTEVQHVMLVGFIRTVLNVLATCKRHQALCCLINLI